MRIVPQNLTILAGSWLALIAINNKILRPAVTWLVHEAPLQSRGESCASTASEAGGFDFIDDPLRPFEDDFLGFVPISPRHGSLQAPIVSAIEVSKDSVFIGQRPKFGLGRFLLSRSCSRVVAYYQLATCWT